MTNTRVVLFRGGSQDGVRLAIPDYLSEYRVHVFDVVDRFFNPDAYSADEKVMPDKTELYRLVKRNIMEFQGLA